MTLVSGSTDARDHSPAPGNSQLALVPGPALRSDIAWHHTRRCDCHKPEASPPCGSCPFTAAWPGMTRATANR